MRLASRVTLLLEALSFSFSLSYPLSVIRSLLSALCYPLSRIHSLVSALSYPLFWTAWAPGATADNQGAKIKVSAGESIGRK